MQCPSCGKPVARADRYCSACLAPLPAAEAHPEAPVATGAPPHAAALAGPLPPPSLPSDPWAAPPSAQVQVQAGWSPPATQLPEGAPAGFWIRFAALLVDSLVIALGSVLVMAVVGLAVGLGAARGGGDGTGAAGAGIVIGYVVLIAGQWAYFALMESSRRQATLGKLALGLGVTDLEGRRIGLGRATGRFFAKILSGIPLNLGYVLAAFTARKQALHDLVAGTLVVRRRSASGGIVALVVVVGFFGAIALTGILAAIAVPNFLRYQLRAKDAEAAAMLASLHGAEVAYHAREGAYLELALPQGAPGNAKLPWSDEDVAAAEALGWEGRGPTWFTYRVGVGETDEGEQAFATCAEADLDGDGRVSAWVTWQPLELPDGTVAAPEPPCALEPVLERPLELRPDDPAGVPVRVSPRDVF